MEKFQRNILANISVWYSNNSFLFTGRQLVFELYIIGRWTDVFEVVIWRGIISFCCVRLRRSAVGSAQWRDLVEQRSELDG